MWWLAAELHLNYGTDPRMLLGDECESYAFVGVLLECAKELARRREFESRKR